MKKIAFIMLSLSFLASAIAAAQSNCGNGLPCGPVPWRIPNLPPLPSPTQIPTIAITNASINPGQPTATPAPSATLFFDPGDTENQLATVQAIMNGTQMPILDPNGTPVDTTAVFEDMSANAGTFFSYAKAVATLDLGFLTPLIVFSITALLGVIAVKLFTLSLPLLMAALGIARRIYDVVMQFIPF